MLPDGVSVVIPVYQSARILPDLIEALVPVLVEATTAFEVILVDDGNTDGCWATISSLSEKYSQVRGIRLMRNYSQHNALLAGIRSASYAITATMDDDMQHPADQLPKLLEALTPEYDVVYGCPERETHGLWRDVASIITKFTLQKAMGSETARMVSAFRVFRTNVRQAFTSYESAFVNIDVLLTWGSSRFRAIQVRHAPRHSGESNYDFRKLLVHATNMLTGFSDLPLKLASVIGFAFTLFGIAVLTYVLGQFVVFGTSVPGFPFLASVIAIFSGAQLFALGIMGEYLARIHFRSMNKPSYSIGETTSPSQPDE